MLQGITDGSSTKNREAAAGRMDDAEHVQEDEHVCFAARSTGAPWLSCISVPKITINSVRDNHFVTSIMESDLKGGPPIIPGTDKGQTPAVS